jgi:RsiW-degrading membrane proteinase PrsW (M82 family)
VRQRSIIFLERLAQLVGVEPLRALPWRVMWTEVFTPHTEEDIESSLAAGAPRTTPTLDAVSTQWPRPWVFGRLLLLALLVYGAFILAWSQSGNRNLIPGLILVGSFAVPMATLMLFFECNVRRNVSLYQLMRMALLGGVLALLLSLFMYRIGAAFPIQGLGTPVAGLVEEPAKLLTLGILINNPRYRFTLHGLLLGAAVGAGLEAGSLLMRAVILSRALCVADAQGLAIPPGTKARLSNTAKRRPASAMRSRARFLAWSRYTSVSG